MPLEEDDQKRVDQAIEEVGADESGTRLLVLNASQTQKLGFWTVICTVVNRSIGISLKTYSLYLADTAFIRIRSLCHTGNIAQSHWKPRCIFTALVSWICHCNVLSLDLA